MAERPITTKAEEGRIVLPPDEDWLNGDWPNGTMVRAEPVEKKRPSVWDVLKKYDGIIIDMPSDYTENLDHYIHGHPKK